MTTKREQVDSLNPTIFFRWTRSSWNVLFFGLVADLVHGNWTQATDTVEWGPRTGHSVVEFDSKIWVMGGRVLSEFRNDVWYSEDGTSWSAATLSAPWSARTGHGSVVFDGKIWIMGGGSAQEVWYSTNGSDWTLATASAEWSPRTIHCVVFNNRIWVMGGEPASGEPGTIRNSEVWYSSDGTNWTAATLSAPWSSNQQVAEFEDVSGRSGFSLVVHDGKMWVLGGNFGSSLVPDYADWQNDVWYSEDGEEWFLATDSADWAARDGHASVVYDSSIWVLGGGKNTGDEVAVIRNDVWFSADGVDWSQAESPPWPPRWGHAAVVHSDKIWILGGRGDVTNLFDVWHGDGLGQLNAKSWMEYR